MVIKLNLGCGTDLKSGYINIDMFPHNETVYKLDINSIPFKLERSTECRTNKQAENIYQHLTDIVTGYMRGEIADKVVCEHTLEHLDTNPHYVMKEIIRITKATCPIEIELPTWLPSIVHQRFFHNIRYMNALVKPLPLHISYVQPLVKLEKTTVSHKNIVGAYRRIKELLQSLTGKNIRFYMRKI